MRLTGFMETAFIILAIKAGKRVCICNMSCLWFGLYAKWNGWVFLRSPFDVYKLLESPLNRVVLDLDSVKVAFQFRELF